MDTDDLSREAYDAVIVEAERFNHELTLRFGLLSYDFYWKYFSFKFSFSLLMENIFIKFHYLSGKYFPKHCL